MTKRLGLEQITAAAECAINHGWLNRLQQIVESQPEYLAQTPLHLGAMSLGGRKLGEDADILACVEYLAEKGMAIAAPLPGLDSCFKYCPSVAHFLLSRGLDPKLADGQGNTGLHCMAEIGYVSAVRTLMGHGAEPGRENDDGQTAWDVAGRNGNRRTQRCLEGEEIDPGVDMEIRWFSQRREYGYVAHSVIEDIYFEHSCERERGLEEGVNVEFELDTDDFGPIAVISHFTDPQES